jgi:hypothetical protein
MVTFLPTELISCIFLSQAGMRAMRKAPPTPGEKPVVVKLITDL